MNEEMTTLLGRVRAGESGAFDQLAVRVYQELKRMSGQVRRGQPRDATLDTTALVHEAYLRLAGGDPGAINDRQHFFALAAKIMRQVLCDHARKRLAQRRGGGAQHEDIVDVEPQVMSEALELVALDQALKSLAENEPRQAQVVECRFFAGLSEEQTAEALGVSLRTVQLDWAAARKVIHRVASE
jgi:RNA polymerase sigma factor (TIGR02999 family)